jgi:hypothetical protein
VNLKTAALIALIGVSVHLILALFGMLGGSFLHQISPFVVQAFWLLNSMIFSGSFILFLAVFYSKQQS